MFSHSTESPLVRWDAPLNPVPIDCLRPPRQPGAWRKSVRFCAALIPLVLCGALVNISPAEGDGAHQAGSQAAAQEPSAANGPAAPPAIPVAPVAGKSARDSVDVVTEQLFRQYVVSGGKIPTRHVNAAIELVAARGRNAGLRLGHRPAFVKTVLAEFEKSCEQENARTTTARRNLLKLISKMLAVEGGLRWRYERARRTGEVEPSATTVTPTPSPENDKIVYRKSEMLERVIARGRQADRHEIDAFVIAVRQAHHPQGKQFLLDVLRNPPRNAEGKLPDNVRDVDDSPLDSPEPPTATEDAPGATGKWPDNVGSSWGEAKFHAAVGLAELGEHAGVEWLIKQSERNEFGVGSMSVSLNHAPHRQATRSNLRESCIHALADLSGLQPTDETAQWTAWWAANKHQYQPRRVALRID